MNYFIKNILLPCVAIALYGRVSAQNPDMEKSTIRGEIVDENHDPVVYANLSLLRSRDSSVVTYTTTNPEGKFEFDKQARGTYLIKAESIGYQTTFSKPISLTAGNPTVTIDTLLMPTDAHQLNAVKISAIRPTIEHKPGQIDINIENSSLSSGNSLRDILQKSPGVFVDQNGQVALNGKSGVQIMIDGQDSHLTADQLANFLENTPAESISKIELMNNPSEKYSAEGTAGIINIVMKKNKNRGIKGSLQTGFTYGSYWRNNSSANLSYNNSKISLYADYSYRRYKNKQRNEITRYFEDPETGEISNSMHQESDLFNTTNTHSTRLGMDYKIDEKQRIGMDLKASFNHSDFDTDSPVYFRNKIGNTDSISQSNNHLGSRWNNESVNLHYNLDPDDNGSTLAVNLDYNRYHDRVSQDLNTFAQDPEKETVTSRIDRRGIQPSTISIYAAKIDYTQALGAGYQLESGIKTSFVKSDNNSIFEIKRANQWKNDPGNTNHFIYKENVNAAYASLRKDFEKGWGLKVGLRAEQVHIKTLQKITDSINSQNYIDFFPNLSVSKAISENHQFNFSYSRRINRPDYQSLNPFIYYIDEYSFQQGNPFLQPEYVDKFTLSYIFKERYSAEISYDHTRDIMTSVIHQNPEKKSIVQTNDNLNTSDNFTLSLNAPIAITPWWDTYNSAQFYKNHYKGLYNEVELDKSQFSYSLNSQQTFLLPGDLKAELNAMYRSKFIMGAFEIKDVGMLSLGFQKSFWEDKASLKLNVNDVFQTLNFDTDVNFDNLHLKTHYISNSRSVNLTFTYNFGNQNLTIKKHEDSSIKEEENRLESSD